MPSRGLFIGLFIGLKNLSKLRKQKFKQRDENTSLFLALLDFSTFGIYWFGLINS
jgi:hypothetical protein